MSTELKVPRLGEDVDEAEVVTVHVAEGDAVEEGQVLVELETGKASVEVPAELAGTIQELKVAPGDKVATGDLLAVLEEGAAAPEEGGNDAAAEEGGGGSPADGGEETGDGGGQDSGDGDQTAGDGAGPSADETAGRPAPAAAKSVAGAARDRSGRGGGGPVAAPSVRRLARRLGVDLARLTPGPDGRVDAAMVQEAAATAERKRSARHDAAGGSARETGGEGPAPTSSAGDGKRIALGANRKRIGAAMTRSAQTIPQVWQQAEADITDLDRLRRDFKQEVEERGGHPGMIVPLALAVARTLRRFPDFNATFDEEAGELVRHPRVDLGIAMDTERGLVVPVLRDAAARSFAALAGDLKELLDRTREDRLTEDELRGATCTLSNLGGGGAGHFTPLIVPGQVAIVGLGRAAERPWVVDGAVVPRLVLPLTVAYDHRVLDGVDGAAFAVALVQALEDPRRLLLDL